MASIDGPVLRGAGNRLRASSSQYDRGPATKGKVDRTKDGCVTCRLRRKKCAPRVPGEALGPCDECKRLLIECLGYRDKLPEWARDKVKVQALRKESTAHIVSKAHFVLSFSPYYENTEFRPDFSVPRTNITSSSTEGDSGGDSPPSSQHDDQSEAMSTSSPSTNTFLASSPLPYEIPPPHDLFPDNGPMSDRVEWFYRHPSALETADFIFTSSIPSEPSSGASGAEHDLFSSHTMASNTSDSAVPETMPGWETGPCIAGSYHVPSLVQPELNADHERMSPHPAELTGSWPEITFEA